MKKLRFILILLAFVLCFSVLSHAEETINAEAYILIEASSGTVLYSKNADERHEPASTTKILTALIAIENCDLETVFKVSKSAAEVEGSQIGLEAGDEVSLGDLLYMLLLKSGNDAAVTIAENIAGDVETFASMMNERAKKAGCENSNFENPHGLGSENHYTTARDLALIAAEALKNPTFAKIVSEKQHTLSYHNLTVANSNRLLRVSDMFCGVKTGFTKAAGRCLVSAAKKDGVTLVAVTLKDGDDWNDHVYLMEKGFERVSSKMLYTAGEYRVETSLLNGDKKAVYVNSENIYGVVIDGREIEYSFSENLLPVIFAPAKKYSYGGSLIMSCGGREAGSYGLYLSEDVAGRETESGFGLFLYNLGKFLKTLL